ncbi:hypothetical protein ABID23_001452 [Bartonella silvatica]|uniref:Phage protein n=1 Tax=Bartonella silvatica TaxID=357760 RepID=A0ABV2HIG6_9HYPH
MENRIRARQRAYFKKLYRKIAFLGLLLFSVAVCCFVIIKMIGYFSSHQQMAQKAPVELAIPVFDSRVYCKEISASVMPNMKGEMYQRCINLESEAYFAVREMWDALSNATKKQCMKMVRPGDGNYFLLRDCLISEKEGKARHYF